MPDTVVRLSPLTDGDSATLFEWINDRNLVTKSGYYRPVSDTAHARWFESIRSDPSVIIFGIRSAADDVLIGSCQLHSIDTTARSAELQIRIGPSSSRGRGFGKAALQRLLQFAFSDLNLNRVFLHVFDDNEQAIRAYTANGFKKEGLLRQSAYIDGQYKDVVVMAILSQDFQSARGVQ